MLMIGVWPLIMGVTMFLQMRMNPTPPDPVQARMMWIMPLVFSVMFFFFPAGLVLYWLTNNILSIAQQWFINNKLGVGITVDKGPQDKRVRPAPMGRAFRVLHRKSHVTIEVSDEA